MNISKRPSKAERKLGYIQSRLHGPGTPAELRISRNGVPHLILDRAGTTYSVAWFGGGKFFRVFYPYGVARPKRVNFKEHYELITWLNDLCP